MKRTFLELGGKSPNIVFADSNLEKAASLAAMAVFYNGGQTCTAGTRLIVEEKIREKFVEMVVASSQDWMPGDPLDPATAMGPMIDAGQLKTVTDYVEIGRQEGASLISGGKQVMAELAQRQRHRFALHVVDVGRHLALGEAALDVA